MEKLIKAAKIAFASEFSFYLKSHAFHWNITGPNFQQYHQLFGTIYEEVYGSIDDFAEKIRSLGSFMPGSYTRFNMLTKVEDEERVLDQDSMIKELLLDNEKMLKILKYTYDAAEAEGEHGFSNFLAERLDSHRRHGWMLRSSLNNK